jgi:hypothetical protein
MSFVVLGIDSRFFIKQTKTSISGKDKGSFDLSGKLNAASKSDRLQAIPPVVHALILARNILFSPIT